MNCKFISRSSQSIPHVAAVLMLVLGCWTGLAIAAEHRVEIRDFVFVPDVLNIAPGDTVIWESVQGVHNVVADDGSFSSGSPTANFSYQRTFDAVGDVPYYCQPHGAPGGLGMSGRIVVAGESGFVIDAGIMGAWFDPETSGQGFSLEVVPSQNQLVAYWFTYSADGSMQQWMVGVGDINNSSASMDMIIPQGGALDQPIAPQTPVWGSATFRFDSCTRGEVEYTSEANGSGLIKLTRLTPVVSCAGNTQ